MFVRNLLLAASIVSLTTLVGCAAPADDATGSTQEDITSAKEPGVEVDAVYRYVVTGTPTYGYDATEPFLWIDIVVDDAAIRRQHPGFDGYERPFVLLPRKDASGAITWERRELAYRGQSQRGYMALRPVDLYGLASTKLSSGDLQAVLAEGVAVGLDSNVGTIWAQDAGKNFVPTKR
jgi:hypothetical protein